ncbi:SEC-C metal-binding domain-containing protein [Paenibacillus sp. GXUN7292]|uniref:SEC-C metal-binding domain-containing protein n=1 Tax=Paenibacillus sp. GXUN7292 TaxID=3422499 RepID=UPI003D7D629E
MSIPGRNDPCPCGSGLKYKKCHLNARGREWIEVAEEINFAHPKEEVIRKTFFLLNDDFTNNDTKGACHLLSSVMYVLMNEQGITSELCIGEVRRPNGQCFDHSWIEIDGKPFDIAIRRPLDGGQFAPVFAGFDLDSGLPTIFNYRFSSEGLDITAERIRATPFVTYINGAPHSLGWGLIISVARSLGLGLDVEDLRERYKDTKRILKH